MGEKIWTPPKPPEPPKQTEVFVHAPYHADIENAIRTIDRAGGTLLGVLKRPPRDNGIGYGWAVVYEHTEEVDIEEKC